MTILDTIIAQKRTEVAALRPRGRSHADGVAVCQPRATPWDQAAPE